LDVSSHDILKMVLKRSITIEAERLSEKAAEAWLAASHAIYRTNLSTSATQSKTASISATNLSGYTSLPNYLTSASTEITVLSATICKKKLSGDFVFIDPAVSIIL